MLSTSASVWRNCLSIAEAVRANDRRVIEAGEPIEFEEAVPSDEGERFVCLREISAARPGPVVRIQSVASQRTSRTASEQKTKSGGSTYRLRSESPSARS